MNKLQLMENDLRCNSFNYAYELITVRIFHSVL
jgi:hypothetical protein